MLNFSELWLIGLALAALAYGLRLYFRSDYSFVETLLYLPAYLLTRLLWRVHFTNSAPEEIRGGAVLAANHRSSIDPMFIQLAARKRVHWMVAKEYCQNFAFRPILRALQVIPTNRTGTDINSTKIAMQYAQQGRLVGMFPEGRINTTRDPLLSVRAGAAMVATKARVPIIPIYIRNSPYFDPLGVTSPFLIATRVIVTFGRPVVADVDDITDAAQPDSSDGHSSEIQSNSNDETVKEFQARDEARLSTEASGTQYYRRNDPEDELIRRWAEEMCKLAGSPKFKVQVGSDAKRRRLQQNALVPEK